VGKLERKGV